MVKMKKMLSLLMATLMGASLVSMAACGEKGSASNNESSSNSASVTECDGHVYSKDLVCIQEPTCLEVGKKAIACEKCGEVKGNTADIAARGHDYKDNGVCNRCGVQAVLPAPDASATYVNVNSEYSSCTGTAFDRYQLSSDNYYEVELGRTKNLWVSVSVPEAGQYALYSTENKGVSVKRYDASTQYIPIDKDGNYIGFDAGVRADGNFVATVSCGDMYWSDQWRATFCLTGEAGSTAKFHIVKIADPAWAPGYTHKDVLAEQIDGKAPNGPEGSLPTVVPYTTEYFYDYNEDTDTGYYRMGTPENPGEIIYVAITSVPVRMLLDATFADIEYQGPNLSLDGGYNADGDHVVLNYAPFIMNDESYGGTYNSYQTFTNDDGLYPVNQELFTFLNLYVQKSMPMDIPDEIWSDPVQRANSAWLAACYYYAELELGSELNPYKVTDNTFTVTTVAYDYVHYNIRYTNETDSNVYVSFVDVICEDANAVMLIGNQSYHGPFKVRIETNYSVGANLKFASKDGSVVNYDIVLQDATDGAADYPIALTPDSDGNVTLNFSTIHMLDGSISYECYYMYTATYTGTITLSTEADIYMLASNATVDANASSDDGETPTSTDTYLNNGVAKMNVTAGDVIAIYVSSSNANPVVFNIQ